MTDFGQEINLVIRNLLFSLFNQLLCEKKKKKTVLLQIEVCQSLVVSFGTHRMRNLKLYISDYQEFTGECT